MKFVIFHGSFGSAEGNWFPELQEKLGALDQEVIIPQFPVEDWNEFTSSGPESQPKSQTLQNWLKTFEMVYKGLKGHKLCFIGHSLGPQFILHVVDKYNIQLDSAIFVSPFFQKLGGDTWQFDHVNGSFYKNDFDFQKLQKLIPQSYVLYSDNDPYVSESHPKEFAQKMNSALIPVKRAGHLNSEVNLNEFPLVFELCKTRLDLSLYQKYMAHRRELYSIDYLKDKKQEVIYLQPGEVFDEGVFKFRNLRHEGFCTFYTGIAFWDTQSKYFNEARRAAKRLKNFTRVFMVDKYTDLERSLLQEQIRLDLEAGVKVYLCPAKDVFSLLDCAPDFGIWDNEYVCIISIDKDNEIDTIRLSSLSEDLEKAKIWKSVILKKAVKIQNIDQDIRKFRDVHAKSSVSQRTAR